VPRVGAVDTVRIVGDWLAVVVAATDCAEVPTDVYLHEIADADAGDPEALRALAEIGLWRSLNTAVPYADLPISTEEQWQRARLDVAVRCGWEFIDNLERARHEVWRHPEFTGFPVHLDEIALRVRVIQRLTQHVQLFAAGEDLTQAWRDCEDELDAWDQFTSLVNAALQEFHVRVYVDRGGSKDDLGGVYPTVYNAAVLQLVNDLSAGTAFRRCANETCGRLYVRQRGRAVYGEYRTVGTKYCSNNCARAQYQREKRRRDKATKKGE
jgi:hypothetical protein